MIDQINPEHEIELDRVELARCRVEAGLYDGLRPDSAPITAVIEGIEQDCGVTPRRARNPLRPSRGIPVARTPGPHTL